MSFIVPNPPNPNENQYKGDPLSYSRAMYDWALKTKGRLEQSKPLANGVAIITPIAGDIAYYSNNFGWTRLAGGNVGQVLTYGTGTAPTWGNISSNLTAGTGITVTGTATDTIALASIANNNLLSNISGTSAAPSPNTLTATIDSAIGGTQGNILYRGTSAWSALVPGVNGQFLQTQGTAANPQWASGPPAGLSTSVAKPGGAIFDHFADANNSGTAETDLYSDTLPASVLGTNGDKIISRYALVFTGALSSTQELRMYFGGTLIFDTGALNLGAVTVNAECDVMIIRESSGVVRCIASTTGFTSTLLSADSQYTRITGLTLSNTQILKITGQAGGVNGASNQITAKQGTVLWQSAA